MSDGHLCFGRREILLCERVLGQFQLLFGHGYRVLRLSYILISVWLGGQLELGGRRVDRRLGLGELLRGGRRGQRRQLRLGQLDLFVGDARLSLFHILGVDQLPHGHGTAVEIRIGLGLDSEQLVLGQANLRFSSLDLALGGPGLKLRQPGFGRIEVCLGLSHHLRSGALLESLQALLSCVQVGPGLGESLLS